jgi:hypothetical protein
MSILGQLFGNPSGLGMMFGIDQAKPKCDQSVCQGHPRPLTLDEKVRIWNTGKVPMMHDQFFTESEQITLKQRRANLRLLG